MAAARQKIMQMFDYINYLQHHYIFTVSNEMQ